MNGADIERNAEIIEMKKNGATYREVAEWYGISQSRAEKIYARYKNFGNTKEEIIRNWEQRKEERRKRDEDLEAYIEKRRGGKHYCIKNGAADVFLTEIKGIGGDTVYKYGSTEIRDAMFFTLEEAKRIAKQRKAVVCWVP